MDQTEIDVRKWALDLANQHPGDHPPENVVQRAQAYLKFLKGE